MGTINLGALRQVTALASATSANGTARNGASLPLNLVHPGSLSLQVTVTIVTGSVVATVRHYVSMDNSTFYEMRDEMGTAPVTITATDTRAFPVPMAVLGWKFYRCSATLSGAATAAGDLTAVVMRHCTPDEIIT